MKQLALDIVIFVLMISGYCGLACADIHETQKITINDSPENFGTAVAVSGNTMVVGATRDDCTNGDPLCGSAYIFTRSTSNANWEFQTKLRAVGEQHHDWFGNTVAISGDTVLIGAPYADDEDPPYLGGAAYIFVRSGSGWIQQAKLIRPDRPEDAWLNHFGYNLALDGNTALVAALGGNSIEKDDAGSAYVFVRSGNSWNLQATLSVRDIPYNGQDLSTGTVIGLSVSLSGNTAIVGAPYDDYPGIENRQYGSAYIFERTGSNWSNSIKLQLPHTDSIQRKQFGESVDVSGTTAIVGSPSSPCINDVENCGKTYIFKRINGAWQMQSSLMSNVPKSESFGRRVAIDGNVAFVGSSDYDVAIAAGAVHVFQESNNDWKWLEKLTASDASRYNLLGDTVSIAGTTVVTSAGRDSQSVNVGAVYSYDISKLIFKHQIPLGTIPPIPPTPIITEFGELTPTGSDQFNGDQDLFVISHGWNPSTDTSLPLWEIAMAFDLRKESGISGGNVLQWNWQVEAMSDHTYNPITGGNLRSDSAIVQEILGAPYDKVRPSGKWLAKAVDEYLKKNATGNYSGAIHMIGHSLGSGVVIQAGLRLADKGYNVNHLTLLDSPWYAFYPSIHFLKLKEFFIDNYYTMLGRPQGYAFADVNIWIDNLYSKPLDKELFVIPFPYLSNGHQLAHQWYRSSINNFQDTSVIGFDDSVPSSTKRYGYYWHNDQNDVPSNMFHFFWEPYWKLRKGMFQTTGEYITDIADALAEVKQKTKNAIEDFAISSAINVTIVAASTLNKAGDTVNYITDAAGHALWVYNVTTGNGYLKLILNSEALASVPVTIPAEATSMQFNYEFLAGCDSQTQLEVYLNDTLVFSELAEDVLGTGEQLSGWINIKGSAGQQVDMTYRLSNPVDGSLGEIAIDDIIFAKLTSLGMQINTGFPWPMFLPAITGAK